jgi:hypothetical protein
MLNDPRQLILEKLIREEQGKQKQICPPADAAPKKRTVPQINKLIDTPDWDAKPRAARKPRPAVAIKKIEKDTGKTVVGATFALDGSVTGVTFARSGEAAAETNPFEIEAARLRALKRSGK